VDLVKVKSTNISAVGYDRQAGILRVLFLEGSMYDYMGVPAGLHNQLMTTDSKGQFFKDHIREQYNFTKVNPEKERKTMGQNKAQKQAAERAKKATAPEVQPQPAVAEPTPTPAPPAAAPASKQTATLDKLKVAWTERKVDLSKMTIQPDGKFILVTVDEGWPVVQIGASGGIVLPQIRSYAKALDAAIDGLSLFQKQNARDAKKATASAPKPAPATPPPAAAQKETPTAKKQKADAALEQQLQQQSA